MTAEDLSVKGISKSYGAAAVPAVDNVTLTVERGQFLSLLGPSGCGKTTLLRMIGGFISPSSGTVWVRGQDVSRLPPQKRPTAMVFQNYALFPHMTCIANVAFGLKVRRLSKSEIAERVQKALAVVGLTHVGERYPHQLSGGQQQRIALARALTVEPPVLLMDEPLGALDAKLREEMQHELCTIQRRLGITTLYVTHDQEEAFSMSDKVAIMNQGRIEQAGSPADIYRRPETIFVANFVGRNNILYGQVDVAPSTIRHIDGQVFSAKIPDGLGTGAAVAMVIRPEELTLGDIADADNRVEGNIERHRFTGGANLYYVRVSARLLMTVEDRISSSLSVGERVRLSWNNSRSIILPLNDSRVPEPLDVKPEASMAK